MRRHVAWLAALALACACGSNESDGDSDGDSEPAPSQQSGGDSGGESDRPGASGQSEGGAPSNMGFLSSLLSTQLDQPGPYDEPEKSADSAGDRPYYAVIELEGPIVELAAFSWRSGMSGLELRTVIEVLERLAADQYARGILLRTGDLAMSTAAAEELRAALIQFKKEGQRKLLCHTEGASNFTYYVLTACDSIGLAPSGQIVVSGVTATPLHVKQLLAKFGVRADFIHIGAYKGAAEPLTRDSPSAEMRKTIAAILDQAFETLLAGIAEGRKVDRTRARNLVDRALFHGDEAAKAGLVDRIAPYEAYRDREIAGKAWKIVSPAGPNKPDITKLMRFTGMIPRSRPSWPHIALVYAVGPVTSGQGGGILGARKEIASRTLIAVLKTLAGDDSVKAVVLRIDSGGGSALASELIWHSIAELEAKKPVVVSMAGAAASGGYYIGCGATRVFALDNTLTGSIGVVGGKLAFRGTLDELGIGAFPMSRGKRALWGAPLDPWTADERSAVKGMMDAIYQTFISRVAQGRGKSVSDIDAVARGRVWTGAQAHEHGLVDRIGGLADAIFEARKLGAVPASAEIEIYPPEPTLMDILNSLGQVSAPKGLATRVADLTGGLGQVLGATEMRAITALVEQALLLRQDRVLAAAFLPAVAR